MSEIPSKMLNHIYNCDYKDLLKKIPDGSVDVLLTDPPYNIDIASWDEAFDLNKWLNDVLPKIADDGAVMIFNTLDNINRTIIPAINAFEDDKHNFVVTDIIDWGKVNPRENVDIYRQHEFMVVAINIVSPTLTENLYNLPIGEIRDNYSRREERWSNVLRLLDSPSTMWDTSQELGIFKLNNINKKHPTSKPIRLLAEIIKRFTVKGDIILDTMSGSGSIPIASYYTNRTFIACEIDEDYARDSIKRLNKVINEVPRTIFFNKEDYIKIDFDDEEDLEDYDYYDDDVKKRGAQFHKWDNRELYDADQDYYINRKFEELTSKLTKKEYYKQLIATSRKASGNEILSEIDEVLIQYWSKGVRTNKKYFELCKNIGEELVNQNRRGDDTMMLFSYESRLSELRTLVRINQYEFKVNSSISLNKLFNEMKGIKYTLFDSGKNLSIVNLLEELKNLLYDCGASSLADDLVEHYFVYQGWKVIAEMLKYEMSRHRNALKNRDVNFAMQRKSRFGYEVSLIDLRNYEPFILKSIVNKTPKGYFEMAKFYYEVVLKTMVTDDYKNYGGRFLETYKNFVDAGMFNKECERPFREALTEVYNLEENNRDVLTIHSMNEVIKKLHITTRRAEQYDLWFFYIYTLSQGTKYRLLSDDIPESLSIIKKRRKRIKVYNGSFVKQYLDRGWTIQKYAENAASKSRRIVSEEYKAYVLDKYDHDKKNIKTETQFNEFARNMHITSKKLKKWLDND